MPSLEELMNTVPGELKNLNEGVDSAFGRAADFAKEAASLPQRLRQAISDKWNSNKDLIESRANSLGDYLSAGSTARQKYEGIFDPQQREALVAQSKAQALAKLQTFSDLLTGRGQKIEDIVGNVADLFSGEVNASNILANAAQNKFSNALSIGNLETGLAGTIESNKMQKENQDFTKLFNVLQISGGDIEVNGKSYHIPGYEEQLKLREQISGGSKSALQKATDATTAAAKAGGNLDTVMGIAANFGLDPDTALNIYNANSPYGHATENADTLYKTYGVKRGELGKATSISSDASSATSALESAGLIPKK